MTFRADARDTSVNTAARVITVRARSTIGRPRVSDVPYGSPTAPPGGLTASRALPPPAQSDATPERISAALALTRRLCRDGHQYKIAGVMLLDRVWRDAAQRGLFDAVNRKRSAALMRVLDALILGAATLPAARV